MPKFTKKPVTVEAVQFTGDNKVDIAAFAGEDYVLAKNGDVMIETTEGVLRAAPGDWIIRGVKGEHYPCKPDVFAATYDPA